MHSHKCLVSILNSCAEFYTNTRDKRYLSVYGSDEAQLKKELLECVQERENSIKYTIGAIYHIYRTNKYWCEAKKRLDK